MSPSPRFVLGIAAPALLALFSIASIAGCSGSGTADEDASGDDADALTTVTPAEAQAAAATDIGQFQLDAPTPAGVAMFKAARYWIDHQLEDLRYPQPRRCAANLSKVAFLGGIQRYDGIAVSSMLDEVKKTGGGELFRLPAPVKKSDGSLDKTAFLAMLNSIHGGHIPVGTFVAGCHSRLCNAEPGEQHIGMIGHTDADGVVWAYHNNWYRPDNEGSRHDWRPYMIFTQFGQDRAEQLYNKKGLQRSWMPTPWLKLKRDESGKIVDAENLLPAVDDMDPFGGKYGGTPTYFITLAVIPEIAKDLAAAATHP